MGSGNDDPEVYMGTGDILARYGIWNYAAVFYVYASGLTQEPNQTLINKIHEGVYNSSSMKDGYEALSAPDVQLNPALLALLAARTKLHFGDIQKASILIQDTFDQEPHLVEERLAQGEYYYKIGEMEEATQLLEEKYLDSTNPEWVRVEAIDLLRKINK